MQIFEVSEKRLKRILINHRFTLFLLLVSIIELLLRYFLRNFVTEDYTIFLQSWFKTIKHMGGVIALKGQVGDYNILYQFAISLLTYIPIRNLYLYKLLSTIFDFLMAISASYLTVRLMNTSEDENKKIFALTYALVLSLPTVFFNSGLWAQCDSIYTTFILLSLLMLIKEKYVYSFISLGVAFAFKFQTIFIMPFFLFVWLIKKRIYIWHFLIIILTFWLSGLPAYIFGRDLLAPFKIYLNQTHTYNHLFMNYYNFSGLIGAKGNTPQNFYQLSKAFILITMLVLIIGYMYLLYIDKFSNFSLIGVATWTIYTCVVFLPSIHERYAYPVDILLLIIAIVNKKYLIVAVPELINTFLSYDRYLFKNTPNIVILSYIVSRAVLNCRFMAV
ncbi:MAG: hypothetical protein ACI31O_02325 [Limosilactobacillus vaginalis]|uniref:hypothetical protein n=1 Tax=Limosilactobacillus vaginalis TaxID=1633 RepID=UPI003F0EED05